MDEKPIQAINDNNSDITNKADYIEITDNSVVPDIAAAIESGQLVENSFDSKIPEILGNKPKEMKHKKLVKIFAIFLAMILLVTLAISSVYIVKAVIKKQATLKISELHADMFSTISQNEDFSLPDNITVKMGDGKNKIVNVIWDKPIKVDSSNLGTQTYKGNLEGFKKTVSYTINVLPVTTSDKFKDVTTLNSAVIYEIDFKTAARTDIKFIWFKVKKDGDFSHQYLPVENGYLRGTIYMPFGPGTYTVTASVTTNTDRYGSYTEPTEFIINNEDKRELRYLTPSLDVQSNSPEIVKMAREITKGCYSDMEKTRAIHDWVAKHIAYDIESLNKGNIRDYSALETLQGRKAICNGYANLTAALNRALGIKTRIVTGWFRDSSLGKEVRENTHGWNETYIDGRWVIQDTTWDSGYIVNGKFKFRLSHKYFDADLFKFSADHVEAGVRE